MPRRNIGEKTNGVTSPWEQLWRKQTIVSTSLLTTRDSICQYKTFSRGHLSSVVHLFSFVNCLYLFYSIYIWIFIYVSLDIVFRALYLSLSLSLSLRLSPSLSFALLSLSLYLSSPQFATRIKSPPFSKITENPKY